MNAPALAAVILGFHAAFTSLDNPQRLFSITTDPQLPPPTTWTPGKGP